jgi:hypothetical protein
VCIDDDGSAANVDIFFWFSFQSVGDSGNQNSEYFEGLSRNGMAHSSRGMQQYGYAI